MRSFRPGFSGFFSFLVIVGAMSAALSSVPGCVPITGDAVNGTLAGTVTNDATGGGLDGAAVSIEPVVEGVDITTGPSGTFSQELPAGVYTVTFSDDGFESQSRTVIMPSCLTPPTPSRYPSKILSARTASGARPVRSAASFSSASSSSSSMGSPPSGGISYCFPSIL